MSFLYRLALCSLSLGCAGINAQAQVSEVSTVTNSGFPENGKFQGSEIESVQTNNGNLHINIPLWSLPGRGVSTKSAFVYDSMGWTLYPSCDGSGNCSYSVMPDQINTLQMPLTTSNQYGFFVGSQTVHNLCHNPTPYYTVRSGYGFRDPNGTQRVVVPDTVNVGGQDTPCWRGLNNGIFYAADGSGWAISYGAIVDKSGGNGGRDSNGNSLTGVGSVLYDTAHRVVTSDGSYYDESNTSRDIGIQTESVTISTHLCQANFSPCAEYPATTWTLPHIITLPNGLKYTVQYVQNDAGEVQSITLPTGAVVSYTYTTIPGAFGGMAVKTRTLTVGSQVSTWTYTYDRSQSSTPTTGTIVVDPAGNETVYTCTPVGSIYASNAEATAPGLPPSCQITKEQYYQGVVPFSRQSTPLFRAGQVCPRPCRRHGQLPMK